MAKTRNVPVMITYAGGYVCKVEDTVTIDCNTILAAKEISHEDATGTPRYSAAGLSRYEDSGRSDAEPCWSHVRDSEFAAAASESAGATAVSGGAGLDEVQLVLVTQRIVTTGTIPLSSCCRKISAAVRAGRFAQDGSGAFCECGSGA